ncbi:MAG TPA: MFS transporter, partial [Polyangiaceae bacterium]|nr:MFS transporter [Polyangiaceae bacterium]
MTLPARLLSITFLESVGTVMIQRGLYFYTHERLAFSERHNLVLALLYGALYVAGALTSHRAARGLGERRVLLGCLCGLLVLHVALSVSAGTSALTAAFVALGLLHGVKWPIVESFYSAGHTPAQLHRMLGRFNVCWACAVPLGVAGSGLLISIRPELLFACAALLNVAALGLTRPLPERPLHLEDEHHERPRAADLERYVRLLGAARWALLLGYTLMFLVAPLMPAIFSGLGLEVRGATLAASVLDAVRLLSFAALGAFSAWHGRWLPIAAALLLLPSGFALMIWGGELWVVIAGELLFGFAAGVSYTTSLYYALVVRNAAVDAGGAHESLIGLGFVLGPLSGL